MNAPARNPRGPGPTFDFGDGATGLDVVQPRSGDVKRAGGGLEHGEVGAEGLDVLGVLCLHRDKVPVGDGAATEGSREGLERTRPGHDGVDLRLVSLDAREILAELGDTVHVLQHLGHEPAGRARTRHEEQRRGRWGTK